jgi:hypothetical protein
VWYKYRYSLAFSSNIEVWAMEGSHDPILGPYKNPFKKPKCKTMDTECIASTLTIEEWDGFIKNLASLRIGTNLICDASTEPKKKDPSSETTEQTSNKQTGYNTRVHKPVQEQRECLMNK